MTAREIALRPVRLRTWTELAYLLTGLPAGIVTFPVVVTGVATGVALLITLVGIPVLVATVYADRGLAWVERRRAALVLGRPIADPVPRAPERPGALAWLKALAVDPQTWRDAAWMLLLFVAGLVGFVIAVVVWGVALWGVTFPLYWWVLPHGALPQISGGADEFVDTWPLALAVGAGGLVLLGLAPWVCAPLAHGQARLARLLLGPSERNRLERRVGELARTRSAAVDAQTSELRRIERDLHDGAQARMVSVTMDLGRAREKLDADPEAARELVESAHAEARTAIADLRRLVGGIAPAVLTDRGLDAALSALVASCRIPVSLDVRLDGRVPSAVEVAAYFVVSESLVNVQKHADATHANVHLRLQGDHLIAEIADYGRGGAAIDAGSGLAGLRDRVAAVDGTLVVTSPDGGPTIVRAEIPCAS